MNYSYFSYYFLNIDCDKLVWYIKLRSNLSDDGISLYENPASKLEEDRRTFSKIEELGNVLCFPSSLKSNFPEPSFVMVWGKEAPPWAGAFSGAVIGNNFK